MEVTCLNCQKVFNKFSCEIKKTNGNFCSQSCAATYNNKLYPKREKTNKCKSCGEIIEAKTVFCPTCIALGKHLRNGKKVREMTIDEYMKFRNNDANKYAGIRADALSLTKKREQVCQVCGYKKHVQVCHIKGIGKFDKSTIVKIVNAPENLILLCPTHHWEFDHNLLDNPGQFVR